MGNMCLAVSGKCRFMFCERGRTGKFSRGLFQGYIPKITWRCNTKFWIRTGYFPVIIHRHLCFS